MPRRKVKSNIKVKVLRESLHLRGAKDIARKYGVSERSAYNWYVQVLEALPDILTEDKPGRKPQVKVKAAPPF